MIDTKILRRKIIDLAVSGKLTSHSRGNAAEELTAIIEKLGNEEQRHINEQEKWVEVPSNWTWARLVDITTNSSLNDGDWVLSKDMVPEGEVKLIQLGSIGDCEYRYKGFKYLTEEHFHELNGKQIYPGYLLINRLVVDKMLSCIIPNIKGILMTAVDVCWVAPSDDLYNLEYLMYALTSTGVQQKVQELGHGVTRFRISKLNLIDIAFPLPPFEEQREIVEKLNELFALLKTIDSLYEQYHSDYGILKEKIVDAGIRGILTDQLPQDGLADDLYEEIVNKKKQLQKSGSIKKSKPLPPVSEEEIPFKIPANWRWVHLDDITTKITSGSTPAGGRKSNAYVESGNCFFREQNIYNDGIHQEGMVYITDELLNTRENSTVIAKDILLNITGGSIGRCALVPDDFGRGSINQHILIIRMVDERLRFYIHRLLCSPYAQKYIKNKSVGDKDGFSGGRCKQMLIPLPPLAEQQRIAEKIDEVLSAVNMVG